MDDRLRKTTWAVPVRVFIYLFPPQMLDSPKAHLINEAVTVLFKERSDNTGYTHI